MQARRIKTVWLGTLAALVGIYFHASSSQATTITAGEKQFCNDDYRKFCGSYGLDTNALRDCMDRAGHSLSHDCIEALIGAGEVSRSEVRRRKNSGNDVRLRPAPQATEGRYLSVRLDDSSSFLFRAPMAK